MPEACRPSVHERSFEFPCSSFESVSENIDKSGLIVHPEVIIAEDVFKGFPQNKKNSC